MLTRAHWELLDHGVEVGVRGIGPTKEGAFEQAALAVTAVIADPAGVDPRQAVDIACRGYDDEMLLVDWLNAVIAEMARRGMLFSRFHVEFRPGQLVGSAAGEPISPQRHRPGGEVKAATYTNLRVAQLSDGSWVAQTVVDVG